MDKVFKEFLYVSRPDSADREEIDIIACLRNAIEMLTPRFERASVKTELVCDTEPLSVLAYGGSLRRSLVNIITNAEQFSPQNGTITINVSTNNNNAVIEICDQGPGIPKEMRRKVFDMFETSRPEGTGLGLFIAKAAIERAGGSIEVLEHSPGACIRINLPLAKD
jgi:signal transduction histidine kinase